MTTPQPRRRSNSRAARRENQRILAASDICHICGKPGADAVDHVIPLARGGADTASNKKPAHHDVPPHCNRRKSDKMPSEVDRKVLLVCGPPGAGKTTYAHTLGLDVYDLDDPRWSFNEGLFRAALIRVREDPKARAVVIRTAATLSARQRAASMCGATDVKVIDTDLATCIDRIRARGRTDPPLRFQINGARKWWDTYEPGPVELSFASLRLRRSRSLS
jgi:hypothetical protein